MISLPLWIWLAGYVEFVARGLLSLDSIPIGLPTLLVAVPLAGIAFKNVQWRGKPQVSVTFACVALLGLLFALTLFAALRPPFLPQEYDAVNYQMGVPHQLLVRHSLGWIPWSVADLWPMAFQWGIAPMNFAFGTVNKIPQWIFAAGAAGCLYRLARQLFPQEKSGALPMLAVLGAHGVATQLGTGMMDLPLLYFPLFSLTALLDQRFTLAALGLAVFAASKAFHPFLVGAAVFAGFAWLLVAEKKIPHALVTRFLLPLAAFTFLLLARSSFVSLEATGTPLFPFAACRFSQGEFCSAEKRPALDQTAATLIGTRNSYGNGRGPKAFLLHLWRVAIPTNGVNNEFDYPLGLPWLLLVVLVLFSLPHGGARRPLLGMAALFWVLWWLNAHQSRWLYPTLAFGWLGTVPEQARARKVLPSLILVSLLFSLISQFRSIYPTARLTPGEIRTQEEAKVKWAAPGTLSSIPLLYVNSRADAHDASDHLWVLR